MTLQSDRIEPIHIEKLFQSKNPGLARLIPSFVYSFLKRVICQDKINEFIEKYGDKKGLEFADGMVEFLDSKFEIQNEEIIKNLDPEGRYVFVANHPFGGPDGVALIAFLGRYFKKLKFPVNDLLLNLKNLNDVFLPVNKHGGQAREAALAMENAYESDAQMIMFPSGMVSRKRAGIIKDLQWQKSFVSKAIKSQRDIVPIHISGHNSKTFYRVANFREAIHFKMNIEMMLLPSETFKKTGQSFTMQIGEPISYQKLNNGERPQVWAERICDIVYDLEK